MQDFWKKHHFEKVLTEDQSPTLRWLASDNQETMHHRGGAYSETQEIYGGPLREMMAAGGRSAISVGLGLGYNEILVAVEALRHHINPPDFFLLSYESEDILKTEFLAWLSDRAQSEIYNEVWSFFSCEMQSPSKSEVQNWLLQSLKHKSWILEKALQPDFQVTRKYECIFYDAFSSKTSPHLWQEDFLEKFWQEAGAEDCLVTTYACTGALKRSLKSADFELILPPGFQSKRNRTMGRRGQFKSSFSSSP
jgi:hypothetical protein